MFGKIATFEFRYQLRQPVFWVVAGLFFLIVFLATASTNVHIGGDTSNVHKNSPFSIANVTLVTTIFFMFVTTAFVANVVVRDEETGFGALVKATRIQKFDYLYGRFFGAFAAAAAAYLFVPLAIWLGSLMPWLDQDTLGPNRLLDYLSNYLVFALPGLFLTSAIFFAVACVTRSMVGAYLGVIVFLIVYFVALVIVAQKPELRHGVAFGEPFGFVAFFDATRYWTAAERNLRQAGFELEVLQNRLLWLGVSFAVLGLCYPLFRFSSRPAKVARQQKLANLAPASAPAPGLGGPLPKPAFDAKTARAQLWARTRLDMAQVFKHPAYFVLLALGLFNSMGSLVSNETLYGAEAYLTTRTAIEALNGSFAFIVVIISIFYAGELVWRDRDRKIHEIIDAAAVPDWAFVLPKTLAITLVLVSTFLVSVLGAMAVQTIKGYSHFELEHYLVWYVLPQSVGAFIITGLAVFAQAVSPHKFVGWGVLVLVFMALPAMMTQAGLEDRLYIYGDVPRTLLSDMNGQGRFWEATWWFLAYWSAMALALLVMAHMLWRRGGDTRLGPRLARLPRRAKGPAGALLAICLAAFAGVGGFIYWNTHVLNVFRTHLDDEKRLADYERDLIRYEHVAQPTVTDVKLDVDLHPHAPEALAQGAYTLENRTGAPLPEVHVRLDREAEMLAQSVAGAHVVKAYPQHNYWIWRFAQPLQPGQRTTLTFRTRRGQHGFTNNGFRTDIVDNGTFLNNFQFTPILGMSRDLLLTDRATRRKHHLTPDELRLPPLSDDPKDRRRNYLGDANWVNADIRVTTDADQTPIAPGYKVADRTHDGRRTVEFRTDSPILHFFSIQSARYAEKHETYKGVDVAVFYDSHHPYNVDRMIKSAEAGLDQYQSRFSPYQFRQYRSIEFPDYAVFAQSFANTVPWSEKLGFLADLRDPNKIDYVTYVGDHELGHQWWGHQVMSTQMQGETVLVETLAQYSAITTMEHLYGPDKIRRFLKYELDNYLRSRGGERLEELPLAKNENQGYIHYRKGSLVMYLLKDQIGQDNVDAALRDVIHDYAFKGPPYPTSLELVRALRAHAPADKQALITDLFEKITLWDVKATKVDAARRADGKWAVRLTVQARKLYADGKGKETETPMTNESYDFGLFSAKPGDGAFGSKDVIAFERRPLGSGTHVFEFVVSKKPAWAGVDPYNKRIDRNSDDNLIQVDK